VERRFEIPGLAIRFERNDYTLFINLKKQNIMAKGMLIKTGMDASSGTMKLKSELKDFTVFIERNNATSSRITVSMVIHDALIDDFDTSKMDKTQAFICAKDEKTVMVEPSSATVTLFDFSAGSGKFEDLILSFEVKAPKSGKVGGPGI
jgi:hypothetical protein